MIGAETASADPAGLGRGPLTRWMPVFGLGPAQPPELPPFTTVRGDRAGRFVARVVFSLPRITVPAAALAIVWQAGEAAVPVVMGIAIDRALATGDVEQLAVWIGVLIALYVTLTVAARLTNRMNAYAVQLLQQRLRATLSRGVLHPLGGSRAPGADVVSVMTNDVARLSNAVLLVVIPIARITAIGFIAVSLVAMHWPLGVVVLLGAPLAVSLVGALSERLSRDTRRYQGELAATVGRATDLITGYRVIKGMRGEGEATARYRDASQDALRGATRNAGVLGRFLVGAGAVNGIFVAAATGLAGWFAVSGQLTIGELIAVVGLTQALLPQLQAIAAVSIPNLASARASAARILDALGAARDTEARSVVESLPSSSPGTDSIEIIVDGHALRLESGQFVGVRCTARTAFRLTAALLDPGTDAGAEVFLDGRAADEIPPEEYRSQVTVSPHHSMLFTGTIRENLTVPGVAPNAGEAALWAAACEDFATDLDAQVGEEGKRLSGGQRQRLALARALVVESPWLVLHDPTTAVDSATEHTIAERLAGFRRGRSTILITVSPALLGACDRVIDLTETP